MDKVTAAVQAVSSDIEAGTVPRTVTTFVELHDYVDANDYLTGDPETDDAIVRAVSTFLARTGTKIERVTVGRNGGGDVKVTARLQGDYVYVQSRPCHVAGFWSEPGADVMRNIVDVLAARHGVKRSGRREHVQGWTYRYRVTATACPDCNVPHADFI